MYFIRIVIKMHGQILSFLLINDVQKHAYVSVCKIGFSIVAKQGMFNAGQQQQRAA